jgi:hypothetical protein
MRTSARTSRGSRSERCAGNARRRTRCSCGQRRSGREREASLLLAYRQGVARADFLPVDSRGALIARGSGVASINVAPETVDRALAVLDALIGAVEKSGHSMSHRSTPAMPFVNATLVPVTIAERFVRTTNTSRIRRADSSMNARRTDRALKYPGTMEGVNWQTSPEPKKPRPRKP